MPKTVNQSKVWNFHVEKRQLALPVVQNDGTIAHLPSGMFATVRTDTNQCLAQVSESRYGILQMGDFIDHIRSGLASVGLDGYKEDITAIDDGRRVYAVYSFPKKTVTVQTKVGDKVQMKLRFANSFDCQTQAFVELLAEILRCTNGMVLPQKELSLYRRHDNNIDPSFVNEVITAAAMNWESGMNAFNRMSHVALDTEQGVNALSRLGLSKRMADKVGAIWQAPDFVEGKARTLYNLYDALTQYLTHDVEKNDKAPRFELAHDRNRTAVMKLAKMVSDGQYFAEMVKSIPVEVVAQETK